MRAAPWSAVPWHRFEAFSHHIRTAAEYQHDRVNLPGGSFNTSVARLRLNYSFSPDVSINGLLQWNSLTQEFSANIVLRVIYARDSNFYFVYNERQTDSSSGWLQGQRATIFKLTYRLYL